MKREAVKRVNQTQAILQKISFILAILWMPSVSLAEDIKVYDYKLTVNKHGDQSIEIYTKITREDDYGRGDWLRPLFSSGSVYVLNLSYKKIVKLNSKMKIEKVVDIDTGIDTGGMKIEKEQWKESESPIQMTVWKGQILVSMRDGIQFYDKDLNKLNFMNLHRFIDKTILEDRKPEWDKKMERPIRSVRLYTAGDYLLIGAKDNHYKHYNKELSRYEYRGGILDYRGCFQAEVYHIPTGKLAWRNHNEHCKIYPKDSKLATGLVEIKSFGNHFVATTVQRYNGYYYMYDGEKRYYGPYRKYRIDLLEPSDRMTIESFLEKYDSYQDDDPRDQSRTTRSIARNDKRWILGSAYQTDGCMVIVEDKFYKTPLFIDTIQRCGNYHYYDIPSSFVYSFEDDKVKSIKITHYNVQ